MAWDELDGHVKYHTNKEGQRMNNLLVRTNGNADPKGKPRVYFTCHPDDVDTCLDAVCEELFAAHDCAIYYREDMSQPLPEETRDTDLGRMNLFVIPVTFKLLDTVNLAMDEDFVFAKNAHIPVLPLMREKDLDEIYSRPDKFGSLQYLDPGTQDITAIDYSEKLKHYLSSVLISDDTAERIRAAFDAYIFLSYRKKDRKYANELMRLIHSNPLCRDIAIWYDEFLTPGESFSAGIDNALKKSELFTLLVTPNLVTETNYVLTDEYPAAIRAGKEMFGAEAVETDPGTVRSCFPELAGGAINMYTDEFQERLIQTIRRLGFEANNDDPAHNFLIGLAYLDGIDVEVNRERALGMITQAAEADTPEAMQKLVSMYQDGVGTERSYHEALKWSKIYADYCRRNYDELDQRVVSAEREVARIYTTLGKNREALEIYEHIYENRCRALGEDSEETISELTSIAHCYNALGDPRRALEVNQKIYPILEAKLGKEHPDTLNTLANLANDYSELGDYQTARDIQEEIYGIRRRIDGDRYERTLVALNNLASTYGRMGALAKEMEYKERVYKLRTEISGDDHPDTLKAKVNLAEAYRMAGNYNKALEMTEEAIAVETKVLGAEHPLTLITMSNMAVICSDLNLHARALELNERIYQTKCRILGEEHPNTLLSQANYAVALINNKKYRQSRGILNQLLPVLKRIYGEDHSTTLNAISNLAFAYTMLGDRKTALEIQEELYEKQCKVLGENHPDTMNTLNSLAFSYSERREFDRALELFEKAYRQRLAALGSEHPETMRSLNNLSAVSFNAGRRKQAVKWADILCESSDAAIHEFIDNICIIYRYCGEHEKAQAVEARKRI